MHVTIEKAAAWLGLAMVAETVALYGGELLISDSPTLHGACIDLALPGRPLEPP